MKDWIPAGWHGVTSRLVAPDAPALVHLLRIAFGATGTFYEDRPSELTIGDSIMMVTENLPAGGKRAGRGPAALAVQWLGDPKRDRRDGDKIEGQTSNEAGGAATQSKEGFHLAI
jgi:hypothetical protein